MIVPCVRHPAHSITPLSLSTLRREPPPYKPLPRAVSFASPAIGSRSSGDCRTAQMASAHRSRGLFFYLEGFHNNRGFQARNAAEGCAPRHVTATPQPETFATGAIILRRGGRQEFAFPTRIFICQSGKWTPPARSTDHAQMSEMPARFTSNPPIDVHTDR